MNLPASFAEKLSAAISRAHVKACVPEDFARVGPVAHYPFSKAQQRFAEANRERIEAEWEALPDGRTHIEQRSFALTERDRIKDDWEKQMDNTATESGAASVAPALSRAVYALADAMLTEREKHDA
jgi:hypothetical protein